MMGISVSVPMWRSVFTTCLACVIAVGLSACGGGGGGKKGALGGGGGGPTNNKPVVTSTPGTTGTVATVYNYQATATDADGDSLVFTLSTFPTGMTVNATTGLVTWTPTVAGAFNVTLNVSDGTDNTQQSWIISVTGGGGGGPNNAPVITSTAPTTGTVGTVYTYNATATDADGNPLAFALTVKPTGMNITPASSTSATVTWTPSAAGSFNVTMTCTDGTDTDTESWVIVVTGGGGGGPTQGLLIGTGSGTPSSVTLRVIADSTNDLNTPRDLDFNPRVPGQLWVCNRDDHSWIVISNATGSSPSAQRIRDTNFSHFHPFPSGIAFGGDAVSYGTPLGTFASIHEYDNGGNWFMGPTLWSSDLTITGAVNPHGLGSHIDMLHTSSFAMGIAWEVGNVYWVFGCPISAPGTPGSSSVSEICRYDFKIDHDVGRDDHSDGTKHHFVNNQVKRVEHIPSHLVVNQATNTLYICDTGNARVVSMPTNAGTVSSSGKWWGTNDGDDFFMTGVTLTTVVGTGLTRPSGIALDKTNGILYVGDFATGFIHAYTLAGVKVNQLDTGLGANRLMGLAIGPDNRMYFCDGGPTFGAAGTNGRIIRIEP